MVSITASTLDNLLGHDTAITDANLENIIDAAINSLNTYGADLPNMGGTAGSKTLSVESKEAGAIIDTALEIYYKFYKSLQASSLGPMSVTPANVLGNPTIANAVEKRARRLAEIEVGYG